ncbi:MAG: hypothetical protein HY927_07770 [Elusimicrobia bacterium]|nr:hypothetical protein [Elusimicrobiota bacterium]
MAIDPSPRPDPEPGPVPASPPVVIPSRARPKAPAGAERAKFAAVAVLAAGLASALIFKDVGRGGPAATRPASSPRDVPARPAAQARMDDAPFGGGAARPAAEPSALQPADGLVPYPERQAQRGPVPAEEPGRLAGRPPASAPRLKPVRYLAAIAKPSGSSDGGLSTSQVENKSFIAGRPATQEEAAAAAQRTAERAKAASDRDWYKIVPPCSWNVMRPGAYCIDERGVVTTQGTRRDCKAWGAADCAEDNKKSVDGTGPRGEDIPAFIQGVRVQPAPMRANSTDGIFYKEAPAPAAEAEGLAPQEFSRPLLPVREAPMLSAPGPSPRAPAACGELACALDGAVVAPCLRKLEVTPDRFIQVTALELNGKAWLLGRCGSQYHYRFLNAADKPLKARLASKSGETWDVDLPPGGATTFTSKRVLGADNPLAGERTGGPHAFGALGE